MTRPKKEAAQLVKKDATAELQISVAEFTRTRDSVVTGLTTLQNAVGELLKAYLKHTNTVLGGGPTTGLDTLAISNFMGGSSTALGAGVAGGDKKAKKPRKEKDPNAPKRPLTAYFLFSGSARPTVREDLGIDATAVQVNDEVLRRWHEMPKEEKATWSAKYNENMEQYRKDLAAYRAEKGLDIEIPDEEDAIAEDDPVVDAVAAMDESSDDSEEEESDDDELSPPPKVPSPPKVAAKTPKSRKPKAGPKTNGAATAGAASSPTPVVAKSTPVPLPGTVAAKEKSPEKRKKGVKEQSPEEPKKKKAKKIKAVEDVFEHIAAPPVVEKKEKRKKRKSET